MSLQALISMRHMWLRESSENKDENGLKKKKKDTKASRLQKFYTEIGLENEFALQNYKIYTSHIYDINSFSTEAPDSAFENDPRNHRGL